MGPAARRYFNSFPPEVQQQILQSWGGGDRGDEWFQNALEAGAVPQEMRPSTTQGGTTSGAPTSGGGGDRRYLAQARKAAQERGEKPPPGINPGTPQYDDWALAWFQSGIDAGDPDILKRAGLYTQAEAADEVGGKNVEQGYNKDFMNSAPASEWLGKRKPTPSELRRYYAEDGRSEDLKRFSDAQVANWLQKWDVTKGGFYTSSGARVDKPTEQGPDGSFVAGFEFKTGGGGSGGGGGRGGGGTTTAPGAAGPGLSASPAAQAATPGAPTGVSGGVTAPATTYGSSPLPATPAATALTPIPGLSGKGTTAPAGGMMTNAFQPAPVQDAWKASGTASTPASGLESLPNPNNVRFNATPAQTTDMTPRPRSGWQGSRGGWGAGSWVASDERLKEPLEMHGPKRRKMTDWRK